MGKAILVIDMPKDCEECQFKYQKGIDGNWCSAMPGGFIGFTTNIPEWCPLKPVPSKYDMEYSTSDFEAGFNSCINEILGE